MLVNYTAILSRWAADVGLDPLAWSYIAICPWSFCTVRKEA